MAIWAGLLRHPPVTLNRRIKTDISDKAICITLSTKQVVTTERARGNQHARIIYNSLGIFRRVWYITMQRSLSEFTGMTIDGKVGCIHGSILNKELLCVKNCEK